MRERPLPLFASSDTFDDGPLAGHPNKSELPVGYLENGVVPRRLWPARWENFYKHYLHRQIERSANLPVLNWTHREGLVADVFPDGSEAARRGARTKYGHTFIAPSDPNKLCYVGVTGRIGTISITPAAGNFTPSHVVYSPTLDIVAFGGSNSSTARGVWFVNAADLSATEQTDSFDLGATTVLVAVDDVTGFIYGVSTSPSRTVGRYTGVWTFGEAMGSGVPTPTVNDHLVVHNNMVILATPGVGSASGNIEIHYLNYILGGTATTRDLGVNSSSAIADFRYLPDVGLYRGILATGEIFEFAEPDGDVDTYIEPAGAPLNSAALFDWLTVGCISGGEGVLAWTTDRTEAYGSSLQPITPRPFTGGTLAERVFTDGHRLFVVQENGTNARLMMSLLTL